MVILDRGASLTPVLQPPSPAVLVNEALFVVLEGRFASWQEIAFEGFSVVFELLGASAVDSAQQVLLAVALECFSLLVGDAGGCSHWGSICLFFGEFWASGLESALA